VTLAEFLASTRESILSDLKRGAPPSLGEYDEAVLKEALDLGSPQIGTVTLEPSAAVLEFIYSGTESAPAILAVRVPAPERIVFLDVPPWVIASIWQGEVTGSYRLESEARAMLDAVRESMEPEANRRLFEPKTPIRRE